MELLKITEFETVGGWMATGATRPNWKWRYIPNMLNLDVARYINILHSYKAIDIKYYAATDCLLYRFKTKEDAHKWVLFVNRKARERNYKW